MNFKTTIILLVLLIAAGVAVYFTNPSKPADETQQTPETPKKLLNFNTSDVDRLVIQPADGKQIVLKRDGLGWHMLEPVDAPAEINGPSEILSDLVAMASTGRVSATGADAAATGLSPPQFKLEIVTKDGHSTKLDIGSRSGTGDQLYVHLDGADQDDLVQADIYDLLDKPYTDFRQKKLLNVNTTEVQKVEVDRPEGTVALQKIGQNWFIQKPSVMPAETTAVTDLVMALSSLQANDFVTETDPNPARYGLDNPSMTVSFSTTPSNPASSTQAATQPTTGASETTVKFGILDVRKQYVYVSTSDSTAVAQVSVGSMDAFKKTAFDLRDKQVVNIDPASVTGITIKTSLPATTRPTTRPASESVTIIDRRPISPATATTTSPTTMAATQPAVKHSVWEVSSVNPPVDAGDGKVNALLSALHPLRVTQYDASPTTAPATADRYTLTIQCPPPLISSYKIELTDPGNSQPLTGRYNDLAFELDRSLLDKIKADFTKPDEASANPTAATPTFSTPPGPAVGPSGP
jgi:hypothetical protein